VSISERFPLFGLISTSSVLRLMSHVSIWSFLVIFPSVDVRLTDVEIIFLIQ